MSNHVAGQSVPWPDDEAVLVFLRRWQREVPTLQHVARHEAAHAVVAHAVGIATRFVTARPSANGPGHHRIDRDNDVSFEGRLRVALAGRAANERQQIFHPFRLDSVATDDATALAQAAVLGAADPERTADILVSALLEVRQLVEHRRRDVLRIAEALGRADLSGDDLCDLLGPLPAPPWPCVSVSDPSRLAVDSPVLDACALALLEVLPVALVFVPGTSDREPRVVWASDADVHVTELELRPRS